MFQTVKAIRVEEISQYEGHDTKKFLAEVTGEDASFVFLSIPSINHVEFRLSHDGSIFDFRSSTAQGEWREVTSLKVGG